MPGDILRSTEWKTVSRILAIGFAVCIASSLSHAQPVVDFDIDVFGGTAYSDSFSQEGVLANPSQPQVYNFHSDNPYGPFNDTGPLQGPGVPSEWTITWDFDGDPWPSGTGSEAKARLGAVFSVRNNLPAGGQPSDNHLFFSILITLDVFTPPPNSVFNGNMSLTLLTDSSPGGASAIGGPLVNFLIDGTDVDSLYPNGYVIDANGNPNDTDNDAANIPMPTSYDGSQPTSIGVRLDFDLSPGERINFTGVFAFTPTPGSAVLLGIAGLFIKRRRRH